MAVEQNAKAYLARTAAQEKQFDALYRQAGAAFALPDCAMWVLYYLSSAAEGLTQQDLIETMLFPKQTINSAVMKLAKQGLLELLLVPGTRNRKTIRLTEAGTALAERTVDRMYRAELRAAEAMGEARMRQFGELYAAFYTALRDEFRKEGLSDEA